MGLRADLDGYRKSRPTWVRTPDRPAHSNLLFAIPAMLSWLPRNRGRCLKFWYVLWLSDGYGIDSAKYN